MKHSADPSPESDAPRSPAPDCPVCGQPMVGRFAYRGRNAGKPFWGCGSFPVCKGTRPMED